MKLLLPSILLTHILLYTACGQKQPNYTNSQPNSQSTNTLHTPTIDSPRPSTIETEEPTYSENGTTYQLPTIQGKNITITDNGNIGFIFPQYAGKIIIFEIMGKDCEYCKKESPILNRIKREFSNNVEVIAIQAQERMSPSATSNFLSQQNINHPVIEGDDAKELLRFVSETYGWTGILPYILLVKNGSTEYTFSDGGASYTELKESIQSLQ